MSLMLAPPPESVAALVATRPAAVRVLQRHRIDFWCGGHRPVDDVCFNVGISTSRLLLEVAAEETGRGAEWDWSRSSLASIIAEIIDRWHRPLEEELPRIQAMADDFARLRRAPRCQELAAIVLALRDDLGPHMMIEEGVLFPLILDGNLALAEFKSTSVRHGHAYLGSLLARIRELTDDFQVPPNAIAPQRSLWRALASLSRSLEEYISVEENVLLPRALAGEDPHRGPMRTQRADA